MNAKYLKTASGRSQM